MTLRHYKIFVTVCDTMNMTMAGEKLFLSQSAVSQTIAELESHYGTKLFERLSRKLYLTQSGKKLLSYARHIVQMNEEADYEMKRIQESGCIRIGASITVCTCVLPKIVTQFQKIKPNSTVEVYEDNTEQIETMILQNHIDIGVVEGEIHSPEIICIPFMEDELVLVCSKQHRFVSMPEVKPMELEKENFIIREAGSGTRKSFEVVMEANNLTWNHSWTCNNSDTIKRAVEEGIGVTVISERTVQNEIDRGELFKIPVEGLIFKRNFKLCYHKNKFLSNLINEFTDIIMNSKKS